MLKAELSGFKIGFIKFMKKYCKPIIIFNLIEICIFVLLVEIVFRCYLFSVSCILLCFLLIQNKILKDNKAQKQLILDNILPICITNKDYEIINANNAYWSILGEPQQKDKALKCYEHRPGKSCHTESCALTQISKGMKICVYESKKEYKGMKRHFIITSKPYFDSYQKLAGVITSFQDITVRKQLEKEKEELIGKLEDSLTKVKLLSGLIPICSSCKKIRDDKGYWNQLETYITNHSEALFSHSICPTCVKKIYPEYSKMKLQMQ